MHWLDGVSDILKAETGDLRQLARLVTNDVTNFYRGQSLAGCDLRGQDLRGLNFENCNLENAILDSDTKIDVKFDPRVSYYEDYVNVEMSPIVERAVYYFAKNVGYSYIAWAYKNLFSKFNQYHILSSFEFYVDVIKKNKELYELCVDTEENSSRNTAVLISSITFNSLIKLQEEEPELNCFNTALVGAIISRMIRLNSKKDYSQLSLSALGLDEPAL